MNQIDRYLIFGLQRVEGWLDPYSAEVIRVLSDVQRQSNFAGAVGEIGVHHGKLFILLILTAAEHEKAFVIDVFENQALNIDASGRGDKKKFLSNLGHWAGRPRAVSIIAKSSLEVRPEELLFACGRVRIASIDGGHTEECALNDLQLIEAVLTEHGIVILDDYFNQHWPGVSAGAAKYLSDPNTKLRPFAISPNKIFLTAPSNANFYRSQLRRQKGFNVETTAKMFGHEVDVYGCSQPKLTLTVCIKELIKRSPIGPYAMAIKAQFKR